MKADEIWQTALGELQLEMTRATFDTWVKPTSLLSYEDGRFAIAVGVRSPADALALRAGRVINPVITRNRQLRPTNRAMIWALRPKFLWRKYLKMLYDVRRCRTVTGVEFVYMQHVLPSGLVRICYYGLLSNRHRPKKLAQCRTGRLRCGTLTRELVSGQDGD